MVRHLESRPDVGLTYADMQAIDEEGAPGKRYSQPESRQVLAWQNWVGVCAMWRRSVWEQVGRFDPEYDTAEDYEYWCRISRSFLLSKCPGGPLLFLRQHPNQGSVLFADKQERLSIRIIRDLFPTNSLKSVLLRRRALSWVAYSTAMDCSYCGGRHLQAVSRIFRSLVLWPFPYPRFGPNPPSKRTKSLIVFLLRFLRMRPNERLPINAGSPTTARSS